MLIEVTITNEDIICGTIGKKVSKTEYIRNKLVEAGIPVLTIFEIPYVKNGNLNWYIERYTGNLNYLWKSDRKFTQ